jgi:hypothetical protein
MVKPIKHILKAPVFSIRFLHYVEWKGETYSFSQFVLCLFTVIYG